MVGARAFVEPGDVGQRRDPRIVPAPHDLQPLGDQRPVDAGQRHHIADRPQGHEIQPGHQIRFGMTLAVPTGVPERAVDRDREQEGDADGGELAAVIDLVEPVGIDHRDRLGERRLGDMVVEHDDVEPPGGGLGESLARRRPAIHRDHQGNALRLERAKPAGIGAVALGHPVRDVDREAVSDRAEKTQQKRRRGRAVDVVIGEHPDPFAVVDRAHHPFAGKVHVAQRGRVGEGRAQRRVEEVVDPFGFDPAPGEHAGDDLGEPVRLGDGERLPVVGRPGVPALAGDRPVDVEISPVGGPRQVHRGPRSNCRARPSGRCSRGCSCVPGCDAPRSAAPSRSSSA